MADDQQAQYDRVKNLADEFKLKAHLAGMEAKALWEDEVQPTLKDLEGKVSSATKDFDVTAELASIERKLRKLIEDVLDVD